MATFTLQSPGKATGYPHDVALETAPVADIEHSAKSIPDSTGKNFIKGCSNIALAHSRCTSCAAPWCSPRITIVVIRSAPNAACLSPCPPADWADTTMSQARTS